MISGTTVVTSNASGLVTYSNLVTTKAGTFTMSASAPGLSSVTSSSFIITPRPIAAISLVNQPANALAGATMAPLTVKGVDVYGNVVPGATINLTSTAASFNGSPTAVTGTTGLAIFSNLSVNTAGSYTFTAGVSGLSVTSSKFTITAAAAATLSFVSQPVGTTAGTIMSSLVVKVTDKYGNVVSGVSVSLFISINTVNGTTTATTTSARLATFSNLYITKAANGYAFSISSGSLPKVTSHGSFNITPGTPKLSLCDPAGRHQRGQPRSSPVIVKMVDNYNNAFVSVAVTTQTQHRHAQRLHRL